VDVKRLVQHPVKFYIRLIVKLVIFKIKTYQT